MYFSQVIVNSGFDVFNLMRRKKESEFYAAHQILWRLFPDQEKRSFLFHQENKKGTILFYVVSKEIPVSEYSFLKIKTKEYNPVIKEGSEFFFKLRANPVVAKPGKNKKTQNKEIAGDNENKKKANPVHHDVWMNAKMMGKQKNLKDLALLEYMDDQVKGWLIRKGESKGFIPLENRISTDCYTQHRFYKPIEKRTIRFSSLDYSGFLRVTDKNEFEKTLFEGLGKKRGFGCGLLLIRNP